MKKFLCVCCASTPSVKGIYTALCILILTVPAFSQVEMNSNNTVAPYLKWEVSVDLKPLFRSDEPYNVMAKWHFTEKKALRLGLGISDYSKTKDTFGINEIKYVNGQNQIQYDQFTRNFGNKMNWNIKLGYQYEFKQGKVSIYTASDFDWVNEFIDFNVPIQNKGELIDKGAVQPFLGYQSIFLMQSRKTALNLIQSLGFKYHINSYLSCAFETAIIGRYIKFSYNAVEDPYINPYYTKFTVKGGSEKHLIFKPLIGLFVNYHF